MTAQVTEVKDKVCVCECVCVKERDLGGADVLKQLPPRFRPF